MCSSYGRNQTCSRHARLWTWRNHRRSINMPRQAFDSSSVLHRCRQHNIRLNKEKFRLNRETVSWIAQVLTSTGIKPDWKKVDAITTMKEPRDRAADLRLLGLATYLARYIIHTIGQRCRPMYRLFPRLSSLIGVTMSSDEMAASGRRSEDWR